MIRVNHVMARSMGPTYLGEGGIPEWGWPLVNTGGQSSGAGSCSGVTKRASASKPLPVLRSMGLGSSNHGPSLIVAVSPSVLQRGALPLDVPPSWISPALAPRARLKAPPWTCRLAPQSTTHLAQREPCRVRADRAMTTGHRCSPSRTESTAVQRIQALRRSPRHDEPRHRDRPEYRVSQ